MRVFLRKWHGKKDLEGEDHYLHFEYVGFKVSLRHLSGDAKKAHRFRSLELRTRKMNLRANSV